MLECCLALEDGEPHYDIKKSIMVFWSSCRSDQVSCLKISI